MCYVSRLFQVNLVIKRLLKVILKTKYSVSYNSIQLMLAFFLWILYFKLYGTFFLSKKSARAIGLSVNNSQDSPLICLTPWLENDRVFNKLKPLIIWMKLIFFIRVYIHVSRFLARVRKHSRLPNKFGLLSCTAICDICVRFFCLMF